MPRDPEGTGNDQPAAKTHIGIVWVREQQKLTWRDGVRYPSDRTTHGLRREKEKRGRMLFEARMKTQGRVGGGKKMGPVTGRGNGAILIGKGS